MKLLDSEIYRKSVSENFNLLKQIDQIDEMFVKSIPLDDGRGVLIPVCALHLQDDAIIATLSDWRSSNTFAFPTQFAVTHSGTRSWMKSKLIDAQGRILFFVLNKTGKIIGHLGFNNCINDDFEMEIDNLIRGEDSDPGIMSVALTTLIRWGHQVIGASHFFLRVFEDNSHAVKFYKKNGFIPDKKIPLKRTEMNGVISYVESTEGSHDKIFLRMLYQPHYEPTDMILTAGPSISSREAFYAWDAARTGWNKRWDHYLTTFERSFAEYVGTKYAIACSSGTGALHIALLALGIGLGDEVIVPDETWIATANAVRYVGATPVFADIELDSWNIDVISAEKLITKKTKAIMPVHMYGHPARMDKIMALAKKYNLKVVEDAAPAIGAEWQGKRCGSFGDFAAFSFQGAKLLVTGEGGMLVTSNEVLYQKALKIWDQGRNPSKQFWIDDYGVKYKMSNVQAAIGLGQLERCDELIAMKRLVFGWYEEGLKDIKSIQLNREVEGAKSIYWMSSLFLDEAASISREDLRAKLKEMKIDTRPVFPPISQYPIWGRTINPQPVAERVGRQAMNLPSGVCLTRDEVMYVCKCIKELLAQTE
jgi:perosamine synthetase